MVMAQKEILKANKGAIEETAGENVDYRVIHPRTINNPGHFFSIELKYEVGGKENTKIKNYSERDFKIHRFIENINLCVNEFHFLDYKLLTILGFFGLVALFVIIGLEIERIIQKLPLLQTG